MREKQNGSLNKKDQALPGLENSGSPSRI
jgi:hypothetical protein